mmetsp:Transcript_1583/g.3008  ORF Transcript_1583/g.3008 Transcript_1583/m.3008 type:complete len:243 (-) Transcript_1583:432-1160(-)
MVKYCRPLTARVAALWANEKFRGSKTCAGREDRRPARWRVEAVLEGGARASLGATIQTATKLEMQVMTQSHSTKSSSFQKPSPRDASSATVTETVPMACSTLNLYRKFGSANILERNPLPPIFINRATSAFPCISSWYRPSTSAGRLPAAFAALKSAGKLIESKALLLKRVEDCDWPSWNRTVFRSWSFRSCRPSACPRESLLSSPSPSSLSLLPDRPFPPPPPRCPLSGPVHSSCKPVVGS